MGRTAGRDRQLSAPLRVSGLVQAASGSRPETARRPTNTAPARPTASSCAANICTSPKAPRACASTTSPASATRACRRRSSPRRSRRSARTRTSVRRTPRASRSRPRSRSIPARNQSELMQGANQEQVMNGIYKYAYITDAEEGLIATDIVVAARPRFAEQLLQARDDVERERRAHRRASRTHRGQHVLCVDRSRRRRARHDRSAQARLRHHGRHRQRAGLAGTVPLSVRQREGRPARRRHHAAGEGARSHVRVHPAARRPQAARRAHLRVRGRRRRRHRDHRHHESGKALRLPDVQRRRKDQRCARCRRRDDERVAVRLRRRRQERPEGAAAHESGIAAEVLRLLARSEAADDRLVSDQERGAVAVERSRSSMASRPIRNRR